MIWIKTLAVSLQATFQMYQIFRILEAIEWEWIIKVCVDISYQVEAIEMAETRSEEAAVTDTWPWPWPARCCMRS